MLRRLQNVAGVGNIDVVGGVPREIRVELHPDRMEALGVGVDAGDGGAQARQYRSAGRYRVHGRAGTHGGNYRPHERPTRLPFSSSWPRVARPPSPWTRSPRLVDGEQEPQSLALLNGQRAVSLDIIKMSGANTIAVVDALRTQMESLRDLLPTAWAWWQWPTARAHPCLAGRCAEDLIEGAILAVPSSSFSSALALHRHHQPDPADLRCSAPFSAYTCSV
ncbi:MAG: hypothetical protein QM762_02065 [Chryseolinea sp.]